MAAAHKPYEGVYGNMDFEKIYGPKEYREYPKAVPTGPHGQNVVVQNRDEEMALRSKLQQDEDDAPAYTAPMVVDPQKEILISRARELGIPFNPKWSKQKLQATVETAEMEIDNLPAELPKVRHSTQPAVQESGAQLTEIREDTPMPETPQEIKDRLMEKAKSLGINAHAMHLWGIPRLKAAIAEQEVKNGQ